MEGLTIGNVYHSLTLPKRIEMLLELCDQPHLDIRHFSNSEIYNKFNYMRVYNTTTNTQLPANYQPRFATNLRELCARNTTIAEKADDIDGEKSSDGASSHNTPNSDSRLRREYDAISDLIFIPDFYSPPSPASSPANSEILEPPSESSLLPVNSDTVISPTSVDCVSPAVSASIPTNSDIVVLSSVVASMISDVDLKQEPLTPPSACSPGASMDHLNPEYDPVTVCESLQEIQSLSQLHSTCQNMTLLQRIVAEPSCQTLVRLPAPSCNPQEESSFTAPGFSEQIGPVTNVPAYQDLTNYTAPKRVTPTNLYGRTKSITLHPASPKDRHPRLRLSPYITSREAAIRSDSIGHKATQREICEFASLIRLGEQYRVDQQQKTSN